MTPDNNILQELLALDSSLANKPVGNVYEVPSGYFEGFAGQVLSRIKALESNDAAEELGHLSPLLSRISRDMPYTMPEGYFEELSSGMTLMAMANHNAPESAEEELASISPLLGGISKQMPYRVPQGYFENLSPRMTEKTEAKVISMQHSKNVSVAKRNWMRLAVAAMIAGIIVLSGLMIFRNTSQPDPVKSFAKFEKKLDKEIQNTSEQELSAFVQQFSVAGPVNEDMHLEPKESLKDIPDADLKEFLQETADPDLDDDAIMN